MASLVASGPIDTATLWRSTSSCSLVLASAGLPVVSWVINSTLRPPIIPLRSLRNNAAPSSCCLPPAASGPVRTVRKPIFSGSEDWAKTRGSGNTLIATPAFSSARRDIPDLSSLTDITHPPCLSGFSLSRILASWILTDHSSLSAARQPAGQAPTPDQPRLFDNIRISNGFRHHESESEGLDALKVCRSTRLTCPCDSFLPAGAGCSEHTCWSDPCAGR